MGMHEGSFVGSLEVIKPGQYQARYLPVMGQG